VLSQDEKKLQIIRGVAESISPVGHLHYKDYIRVLYLGVKQKLGRYSYLDFSEDMGFGRCNYSRLVTIGERTLTEKSAIKWLQGLGLRGVKRKYFLLLVEFVNARNTNRRDQLFGELTAVKETMAKDATGALAANMLRYIERWYLPIIREMIDLECFRPDPQWIREKLWFPVHLKEIRSALSTLQELGFIKKLDNGDYQRTEDKIRTPMELNELAAIRYHQKMIALGSDSITRVPSSKREIQTQTVAIPKAAMKVLRRNIEKLLDGMEALEDGSTDCEVYQLNVQLFPVTETGD
jgi:uncharacterized protein (TIGR02147 family)